VNVLVEANIIPYSEDLHREDYYDMLYEYFTWYDKEILDHYGFHLFPNGIVKPIVNEYAPSWTALKPPEGVVLILQVDGKNAGTCRVNILEKGVGEINNLYIYPQYRRMGYSTKMMDKIEDAARDCGFNILRLDHGVFNVPAHRLYEKLGYKVIARYTEKSILENDVTQSYYDEMVYMKKIL